MDAPRYRKVDMPYHNVSLCSFLKCFRGQHLPGRGVNTGYPEKKGDMDMALWNGSLEGGYRHPILYPCIPPIWITLIRHLNDPEIHTGQLYLHLNEKKVKKMYLILDY